MKRLRIVPFLTIALCCSANQSFAQNAVDELYGMGVHAYFAHDALQSQDLLTQAIDAGSQDPRVFYFRGLAQSQTNGMDAAILDFVKGAELEADGKSVVNVGKALERVQGHARLEIEKARLDARLAARTEAMMMQRSRMDQMESAAQNPAPAQPGPTGDAAIDPFGDDPELLDGPAEDMPPPTEVPPMTTDALPGDQPPADDTSGFPGLDDDTTDGDAPVAETDAPATDKPSDEPSDNPFDF